MDDEQIDGQAAYEQSRPGIAILTAWTSDRPITFVSEYVDELLADANSHAERVRALEEVVVGLLHVSAALLVGLSKKSGHSKEEILRALGRTVAGDFQNDT